MAIANIDLPNGTKVHIEGSVEEVNKILELYTMSVNKQNDGATDMVPHGRKGQHAKHVRRVDGSKRTTGGVMQHIRGLIDEEYFSEQRPISSVQSRLEELGHIYPLTHLSTPLRRLVRNKELRRMRDGKNWVYVNA